MYSDAACPSPSLGAPTARIPDELTFRRDDLSFEEAMKIVAISLRSSGVNKRIAAEGLVWIEERGLHQRAGCRTIIQFAMVHYDICRTYARDLVAVGRALRELPEIDRAFADKRLNWSKLRALARVVTPETERVWLEKALALSIQKLELEVRLARRGEKPRDNRKGVPEIRCQRQFSLPADVDRKYEAVREMMHERAGRKLKDWECFDGMLEIVRSVLEENDGSPAAGQASESSYAVIVSRDDDGGEGDGDAEDTALIELEDGPVPVTEAMAAMAACDGCSIDPSDPAARPEKTPRPLRRSVLARDNHRCRCCGNCFSPHAHHVIARADGGPTKAWNEVTVCRRCHGLIHAELIAVSFMRRKGKYVGFRFTDAEGNDLHGPADVTRYLDGLDEEYLLRLLPEVGEGVSQCDTCSAGTGVRGRPPGTLFADIVGQRSVVSSLEQAVRVAGKLDQPVGHVLLYGPPGLGKTTIAQAIATERGVRLHATTAGMLATPEELAAVLKSVKDNDVLFVDEIHGLSQCVTEVLYSAMERPITIVGATTEPGSLLPPLLSRFQYREHLEWYAAGDLAEIVRREAAREELPITSRAAEKLASVSRETAREALRLFGRACLECRDAGEAVVDTSIVERVLERLGIDERGLRPVDRRYLELLARGWPLSRRRLAILLGVDERTVERDIEPYLIRLGLVAVTPLGRMLQRV